LVQGTGVDIIEIDRIKAAAEQNQRFLGRIFTTAELNYCHKRTNPWPCLAARFAAKEAVIKAFPGSGSSPSFQEIEIVKDGRAPKVRLHGLAAELARQAGVSFTITISHSREYAIAMALAVNAGGEEE